MKNVNEVHLCKKCQKPLPMNYKHRYCEACLNKSASAVKKGLKGIGATAATVLGLVVVITTKGKINPKK